MAGQHGGPGFWRVARQVAGRVAVGGLRGAVYWPGMVALVAAYALVAGLLYDRTYAQLLGGLAALVVGVTWYASPLRGWEARRRARSFGRDRRVSRRRRGRDEGVGRS